MKLEERTFGTPPYLLMRFIDIQLNKICVIFYALLCAYLLDNVISSEVPGSWVVRSQNDTEDQAVVQCSPDARQNVHMQESVSSLIQLVIPGKLGYLASE